MCRYAKSRSCRGTRSWYAVTASEDRSIWIRRASRGRLEVPLSWNEVNGTGGLLTVAGTGAEAASI